MLTLLATSIVTSFDLAVAIDVSKYTYTDGTQNLKTFLIQDMLLLLATMLALLVFPNITSLAA